MERNLITIEDYEPLVGPEMVERIRTKAQRLQGLHVAHVNSTYYGGGVAEVLAPLTLLMNSVGIKTGWRVIQGSPDFFSITKKMHNALQSGSMNLSARKMEIYENVIYENACRNHLTHDVVIIHDPQPLALINHYKKKGPWIWRCHIDLTDPQRELWHYLRPFIEKYDATILSIREYDQELTIPRVLFMPAIDPFSIKNRNLTNEEIDERLDRYGIPVDLPLVVQISRFDRWKDPEGTIRAYKLARKKVGCTLVLLGNVATDDPEGDVLYKALLDQRDKRIFILCHQDTALVNALQRRAAVVLQKSIREGFGLTVTEAMWKGAPVVAGDVGGIRYQIKDGVNGYLVSTAEEAAAKIVQLIKDDDMRESIGRQAKKSVREGFLLIRLLEDYIDLLSSFKTIYRLTDDTPLHTLH